MRPGRKRTQRYSTHQEDESDRVPEVISKYQDKMYTTVEAFLIGDGYIGDNYRFPERHKLVQERKIRVLYTTQL